MKFLSGNTCWQIQVFGSKKFIMWTQFVLELSLLVLHLASKALYNADIHL